jgi:hypothetical protein
MHKRLADDAVIGVKVEAEMIRTQPRWDSATLGEPTVYDPDYVTRIADYLMPGTKQNPYVLHLSRHVADLVERETGESAQAYADWLFIPHVKVVVVDA